MELDLPVIWAFVISFGVIMYVVMDGFDLGVGILFAVSRDTSERDVMMNSVAPFWDGNETWLVLGAGALFAAFPLAYATLFPALYLPLILFLFALIFRGVSFEFRFKAEESKHWWSIAFGLGSGVAAFTQGVLLGAFVRGFEVRDGAIVGGAFAWASWFSLLTGVALVLGYALLGACWLVLKTEGELQRRCWGYAKVLTAAVIAAMALVSLWTPLSDEAIAARWFSWPNILVLSPVPIMTAVVALLLWRALERQDERAPLPLAIGLFVLGFVGLGISLWPYIVPRVYTIWDAAADPSSQAFLLVGVVIFIPVILVYTAHTYRVFRGKTTGEGYH